MESSGARLSVISRLRSDSRTNRAAPFSASKSKRKCRHAHQGWGVVCLDLIAMRQIFEPRRCDGAGDCAAENAAAGVRDQVPDHMSQRTWLGSWESPTVLPVPQMRSLRVSLLAFEAYIAVTKIVVPLGGEDPFVLG